jgi:hypothetical protein
MLFNNSFCYIFRWEPGVNVKKKEGKDGKEEKNCLEKNIKG